MFSKKTFKCAFVFFLLSGAVACRYGVRPDAMASALEAGDYTALVEGCGNQLIPGYTYCRVRESDQIGDATLYFVVPPIICLQKDPVSGQPWNSCATIEIFYPNGDPTFSLSVPRDPKTGASLTRVAVKWKDLIKRSTFQKGDRGFWPFRTTLHWIDPNGKDQRTITEGEIRMRVIASQVCDSLNQCHAYLPLQDMPEDANYVWVFSDSQLIKMTTGGRAYVSKLLSRIMVR